MGQTFRATDALRELLAGEIEVTHVGSDGKGVIIDVPGHGRIVMPRSLVELATPDEPGPGAYLIGDAPCVRRDREDGVNDLYRWILPEQPGRWAWPAVWERHGGPGVTIVPLVPATQAPEPVELPWQSTPDFDGDRLEISGSLNPDAAGAARTPPRGANLTAADCRRASIAFAQLAEQGGA